MPYQILPAADNVESQTIYFNYKYEPLCVRPTLIPRSTIIQIF